MATVDRPRRLRPRRHRAPGHPRSCGPRASPISTSTRPVPRRGDRGGGRRRPAAVRARCGSSPWWAALTGTATGFSLTIWTSLKWELITGGKPVVSIPPFVIIAFELTILLGGLARCSGSWSSAACRAQAVAAPTTRGSAPTASASRWRASPSERQAVQDGPPQRGRRGGPGMKWVFLLCLLVVGAVAAVMGGLVAYRWTTSMQNDVKLVPGPGDDGSASGHGAARRRRAHDRARGVLAAQRIRSRPTRQSLARGKKLFDIYCTPCHGPAGKGDGPVTPRVHPAADLTSQPVQAKPDGHFSYYIGCGGAIMPAYGEALVGQRAVGHRELPARPGEEGMTRGPPPGQVRDPRGRRASCSDPHPPGGAQLPGGPGGRLRHARLGRLPREPAVLVRAVGRRAGHRRRSSS